MPRWTAAARERQRQVINRVQPWQRSTGPRSAHGKAQSARNGKMHPPRAPGTHPDELRRELRHWWGMLRLSRHLAQWDVSTPDDFKNVCAMILAIEHDLGINEQDTQRRILKALMAQARL